MEGVGRFTKSLEFKKILFVSIPLLLLKKTSLIAFPQMTNESIA